jgi:formyl-CoA transferase
MASTAERLAHWAHAYAPTGADHEPARRTLADTVAVTVAARGGRMHALTAGLPDAARWAAVGHVLDFDDLHLPSTAHVSVVCVAATLATGGGAGAYLAGAGVMARLGTALGWAHYTRGWHVTCTAGAPGAAVAAATALGLTPARTAHAIALALPQAGGVQRAFGTDGKALQVGLAADAGVRAARLAAAGATADPATLDQWLALLGGDPGAVDLTGPAVPGGLAIKLHPCCYALQRPISALRGVAAGPRGTGVRSIHVRTTAASTQPLIHHRPATGLQGKFSMEYAIAAALLDGRPGFASFTDEAVRRPAARGLVELGDRARRRGAPERRRHDHPQRRAHRHRGAAARRAGPPADGRRAGREAGRLRPGHHRGLDVRTHPADRGGLVTAPLSGITVVSLEQAVAAPYATRQLADLGARVIKVERPGGGDFARRYDESVLGQSSYFVWLNRSKESVTLDVKHPAARAVLTELVATADVFVHNLAPGAARRLGLHAEPLRASNDKLVHCTISGYGTDGPWAHRKAYDLLVQCETGVVSLTGTEEEMAKVGISIADIAAGMHAYSGILAALLRRAGTGEGTTVEVSLFEALAEWLGSPAYYTAYGPHQPRRVGAEHATIAPYGPFTSADGDTVVLAVQNEREWVALCTALLGDPALATDERFATNPARVAHREELNVLLRRRFATLGTAAAVALLDEAGVANGRVNTVAEFLDHPVLAGRGRWREVDSPGGVIRALRPPVDLGGVEPVMDPIPAPGEHTERVLRALGRTDHDIAELRAARAI